MSGKNTKTVQAIMGEIFEVDISDKACGKFDTKDAKFRHGDRMEFPGLGKGTVEGVAPSTEESPQQDVLWYALNVNNGRVSYSSRRDIRDITPA